MKNKVLLMMLSILFICSSQAQSNNKNDATDSKKMKYSGSIEIGWGSDYNIILYTSHGVMISEKLYAGLCSGINTPMDAYRNDSVEVGGDITVIPMLVDVKYKFLNRGFSPIASLRFGGENTINTIWTDPTRSLVNREYKLVGIISPSVGIRQRVGKCCGLTLNYSWHFRTSSTKTISRTANSITLGFEF